MPEALAPRQPLLPLPGFMPDAVNFASRLTLAMLLAYLFSFLIQLQSASSAGVCVAIVMQPAPGMAFSKAIYRTLGTVLGGAASLVAIALFPQDRVMLLIAFAAWLAACTFVASLLRDFRTYGAVLSGYTVAIIAVSQIDDPSGSLFAALDRVAAILVGVVSVGLANSILTSETAHAQLVGALQVRLDQARGIALEVLAGRGQPINEEAFIRDLADIVGLRTEAAYAATEFPDGTKRSRAATAAIAGLLAMAAGNRVIWLLLPRAGPDGPHPETRAYLAAMADAIRNDQSAEEPSRLAADPLDALLMERAYLLATEYRDAQAGLHATITGDMAAAPPPVRLATHYDLVTAGTNALRTLFAVALGAGFCIAAGVPNSTLLLVQLAAFVALFGMQTNPIAPAAGFAIALLIAALFTGLLKFLVLPFASGPVPFALVVGGATFATGLVMRHPLTAQLGSPILLYFTLLLSPSNAQTFDLSAFLNEFIEIMVATGAMALIFFLVLPVVPGWRLLLLVQSSARALQRTMRHPRPLTQAATLARTVDRLAQAVPWAPKGRPGRVAILNRMRDFAELDISLRRAWSSLHDPAFAAPEFADAIDDARRAVANPTSGALDRAARSLLGHPAAGQAPRAVSKAAAYTYAAGLLLARERRALRHYKIAGP